MAKNNLSKLYKIANAWKLKTASSSNNLTMTALTMAQDFGKAMAPLLDLNPSNVANKVREALERAVGEDLGRYKDNQRYQLSRVEKIFKTLLEQEGKNYTSDIKEELGKNLPLKDVLSNYATLFEARAWGQYQKELEMGPEGRFLDEKDVVKPGPFD
jgi:hypothetical protein